MPAPQLGRTAFSQGSRRIRVRSYQGSWVDGRWMEHGDSDRFVRAAVRPVSPSDRRLLPEGMRTEDSLTLLTRVPLVVEQSAENGARAADQVFVDGWWWRVVGEKSWAPNGFRRYLAIRTPKGADRP